MVYKGSVGRIRLGTWIGIDQNLFQPKFVLLLRQLLLAEVVGKGQLHGLESGAAGQRIPAKQVRLLAEHHRQVGAKPKRRHLDRFLEM